MNLTDLIAYLLAAACFVVVSVAKAEPDLKWVVAIAQVESGLDAGAYNEDEDARGVLQIRPIMVRDVNRIQALNGHDRRYTHDDAWDVESSWEMFLTYSRHYAPNGTAQTWARNWNGGPSGHEKEATLPYWEKVQTAYTEMEAQ